MIPPSAARGWTRARDELLETAPVLGDDAAKSRVGALVLVIKYTVAVLVCGGKDYA